MSVPSLTKAVKLPLFVLLGAFSLTGCAQQTTPATSEPVQLETPSGTLYGTLEMPSGKGPFTVALIHPGSGPTDRDGNAGVVQLDNLKLLAEALARSGVASVRVDKRGVGESAAATTSEAALRFDTYVEDTTQWLRQLGGDPRFNTVAVVGHSEGALIGLIAAKRADADVYVSIAGAGERASNTLRRQLSQQLPETLMQEVDALLKRLEAGEVVDPLPESIANIPVLAGLFRPSVQPYLISWFRYDPAQEISTLDIPALIVQGTTDLQVSEEDARKLKEAQPDADSVLIPGMNHVFKEAPADPVANQATYTNPDLPLADGLVEPLVTFLEKTSKPHGYRKTLAFQRSEPLRRLFRADFAALEQPQNIGTLPPHLLRFGRRFVPERTEQPVKTAPHGGIRHP